MPILRCILKINAVKMKIPRFTPTVRTFNHSSAFFASSLMTEPQMQACTPAMSRIRRCRPLRVGAASKVKASAAISLLAKRFSVAVLSSNDSWHRDASVSWAMALSISGSSVAWVRGAEAVGVELSPVIINCSPSDSDLSDWTHSSSEKGPSELSSSLGCT